jgi:hypothetical protein
MLVIGLLVYSSVLSFVVCFRRFVVKLEVRHAAP